MDQPVEIGSAKNESEPEARVLKAGALEITYTSGSIRDINVAGHEVLRMIYFALRDKQWNTIVPVVVNEKIRTDENSFHITFDCIYQEQEIDFVFHVDIIGSAQNQIVFDIQGEALSEFQTNRTGFCVLHPIVGCAGEDCKITAPDGTISIARFPTIISPHQPMRNIAEMSWNIGDDGKATIYFKGEVFEMEDQRNWTDDSYKTYCRPLELPFPYLLRKGDKIQQNITLHVAAPQHRMNQKTNGHYFGYDPGVTFPIPKFGIGQPQSSVQLSEKQADLIRTAKFDFYDVPLTFVEGWETMLNDAWIQAGLLGLQVKLKVLFTKEYKIEIDQLKQALGDGESNLVYLFVLYSGSPATPASFLELVIPLLREAFPKVKIGAGTSGYFAALNRSRITNEGLDFISYSINPQVHAFDRLTMVENLKGQSATVATAKSFSGNTKIHISPVTLKAQKNPFPLSYKEPRIGDNADADERQKSLFGAAWTLGSIKQLIGSRTEAITYFETIGSRGIISQSDPVLVYPLYYVFEEVLKNKNAMMLHSRSSNPMVFEGIVFKIEGRKNIVIANFTNEHIEVAIEGIAENARIRKLDEKSLEKAVYHHEDYVKSQWCDFKFEKPINYIKIRPHGIVFVEE